MSTNNPSFFRMIRAPFLSSIISPLLAGTLLSVSITKDFAILNFILVLIIGITLHVATNVYNDIYDTIQGTDKINVNRNEFSGGSGVLIENPNLFSSMYRIARSALIIALITTVILFFQINNSLRIYLLLLFLLSAFFSKYYSAAPIKLAYRGWGEISVWFAFGPMALLIAAISQNVGFHNIIIIAMPITGISTLSILLIGQMIDFEADKKTGKWGVAVRFGNKTTAFIYLFVQLLLSSNIVLLSFYSLGNREFILLALIPYILLLPKILKILFPNFDNPEELKKAAKLNVLLHLSFSLIFILALLLLFV